MSTLGRKIRPDLDKFQPGGANRQDAQQAVELLHGHPRRYVNAQCEVGMFLGKLSLFIFFYLLFSSQHLQERFLLLQSTDGFASNANQYFKQHKYVFIMLNFTTSMLKQSKANSETARFFN